jgi:glycosyl transferase family 4
MLASVAGYCLSGQTLPVVRPLRAGELEELPPDVVRSNFYGRFDRPALLPSLLQKPAKALFHLVGLVRLVVASRRERVDVVHFQWAVLPAFDALAMWVLRLRSKVIFTVHDMVAFNGEKISFLQNFGFDLPICAANAIIVHTSAVRDALIARGTPGNRIRIVAHGPLSMRVTVLPKRTKAAGKPFVFTLFEVHNDHNAGISFGAAGVPFTVVGQRLGIRGAVNTKDYVAAIRQGWEKVNSKTQLAEPSLQFVAADSDGYCDPVTGVCMLPGAKTAPGQGGRSLKAPGSTNAEANEIVTCVAPRDEK